MSNDTRTRPEASFPSWVESELRAALCDVEDLERRLGSLGDRLGGALGNIEDDAWDAQGATADEGIAARLARLEAMVETLAVLSATPPDNPARAAIAGELEAMADREPIVSVLYDAVVAGQGGAPWTASCFCRWSSGQRTDPAAAEAEGHEHLREVHGRFASDCPELGRVHVWPAEAA